MKTYSIAEINDLDHGIPISRFEGRIKKVFEQKSGEGQYGTWYLQNLIVEDGQQEITVTWTGDDAFDAGVEGSVYSFETGYDKKDKPVGIMRDIRSKNGKKYEGVKVDNRSKIKREEPQQGQGEPTAFSKARDTMQQGEPRMPRSDDEQDWPEAPPIAPEQRVEPDRPLNGVTDTRQHLMQSANLYNLCVAAVDKAIAPHMPEIAQTSEMFQAAVASLYIEASKDVWWSGKIVKESYLSRMPTKPIE